MARSQTFLAAESLLGEDMLIDWAGRLDTVAEMTEPLPPGALRRAFIMLAANQRSKLPAEPFLERRKSQAWTGIDLKPKQAGGLFPPLRPVDRCDVRAGHVAQCA